VCAVAAGRDTLVQFGGLGGGGAPRVDHNQALLRMRVTWLPASSKRNRQPPPQYGQMLSPRTVRDDTSLRCRPRTGSWHACCVGLPTSKAKSWAGGRDRKCRVGREQLMCQRVLSGARVHRNVLPWASFRACTEAGNGSLYGRDAQEAGTTCPGGGRHGWLRDTGSLQSFHGRLPSPLWSAQAPSS
jgi:hypothetical protein